MSDFAKLICTAALFLMIGTPAWAADPGGMQSINNQQECEGYIDTYGREDHIRQPYVSCQASGPLLQYDVYVCRLTASGEICLNDGSGPFFYVRNITRGAPGNHPELYKITIQNSVNNPTPAQFRVHYHFWYLQSARRR